MGHRGLRHQREGRQAGRDRLARGGHKARPHQAHHALPLPEKEHCEPGLHEGEGPNRHRDVHPGAHA